MMQTSSSGIKKAPAKMPKPARLNSAAAVFASTVSRCRNPLILYFVAMFIFGPVSLLMSSRIDYQGRLSLEASLLPLGYLVPIGASVVIPLVVFSYLDNKRALDVFHSLPVTRVKMFTGNFLAGLAMLYAPFLIMIFPVALAIEINRYFRSAMYDSNSMTFEYLTNFFWVVAVAFFCFVLMTLLVISCSTLLESVGYFAIILLGYVGLVVITFNLIGSATFGYTEFPIEDFFLRFSPICMVNFSSLTDAWRTKCAIQIIITGLVLIYLCYHRIRARKSEQVGGGYVWPPLYYIAAIGGSIAAGLVSINVFGVSGTGIILSVVIGILVYIILDTIRNRGFKNILRSGIVSVCATAGVGVIALVINVTGTFGYEQWLPKENEIASVSVNLDGQVNTLSLANDFALSDTESIQRVLASHQSILANQEVVETGAIRPDPLVEYTPYVFDSGAPAYAYGSKSVQITYTLKNGKTVRRHYHNVPTSLTKLLSDIAGSQAYSCSMAEKLDGIADYLGSLNSDQMTALNKYYGSCYQIQLIDIGGLGVYSEDMSLTGDMQKELLDAFAEDLRRRPEGWRTNPDTQPIGSIYMSGAVVQDTQNLREDFFPSSEWYNYTFFLYEIDINTLSLLEDWGYYDAKTNQLLPNRTYTHYRDSTQAEASIISVEYYDLLKENIDGDIFHFASSSGGIYSVWEMNTDRKVSTMENENLRYYIGELEKDSVDVTDRVVNREFTEEELEELRKLTLQVGISDEPMNVLYLNSCTYLIPEENLERVEEIVYSGGAEG